MRLRGVRLPATKRWTAAESRPYLSLLLLLMILLLIKTKRGG